MTAPRSEHYLWWGEATAQAVGAIYAAGPVVRIEQHGEGEHATLHFLRPGEAVASADCILNESHPCPPFCG